VRPEETCLLGRLRPPHAVPYLRMLEDHVSLTGVVSNPTMHGMKEDAKDKTEKNPVEKGTITATGLKMVSESCSVK
jgi:hypothetical protein